MAEIKLNLREPNSEKETPINLIVRFNGQKRVYSSGKRVHPKSWETANQRVKKNKDSVHADILNANLREMIRIIHNVIETYLKENHQMFPSLKELKERLDIVLRG